MSDKTRIFTPTPQITDPAPVPLVTVFAGAPCPRFEQRWRPFSAGAAEVVPAGDDVLERVVEAVGRLL